MAAGKTYVTKGYSTYTNIPAQRDAYDHDQPKQVLNRYAVETKTIDRVRAPAGGFTDFVGSPSKVELLKEYVHSPTMLIPKYGQKNQYEDYEPNYQNSASPPVSPNKHLFSNPARGYHSEESNRIHSGGPGLRHVRTGNISEIPNKSWQSTAGPPATNHPLTTSTNKISEALGFLEESSVHYSPRADPRRRGVLDDLSTRAQPLEPQRRYARPAFVAKPKDVRHNTAAGNTQGPSLWRNLEA